MKNLNHCLLASTILVIFFSSCNKIGTGVVLWPPEDSQFKPGDLLTVADESFLRNTYIINRPDQRRLKDEIDQWRVRLFHKKNEALAWVESMGEWRDVYAECLRQGLPMRSEPSNVSSRVYRLRENENIKVLGREPGPVKVGNLEGFWYQVLADGGTEGYVFDYYLKVERKSGSESIVLNARDNVDAVLNNFLSAPWYPKYFEVMINNKHIDLRLLHPKYGLFINRESQTITLRLADTFITENWTTIVPSGSNRYDFLGTSFRVTVNSETFASVQYNANGAEHFEAFIRLRRSIEGIVNEEIQRRSTVLNTIKNNGPLYGSIAYGELAFLNDGRFSWNGKSSLISRGIISSQSGNSGNLMFDHFMNTSIAANHDGVLNFHFDNGESIRFLYTFEDDGLRMLHVPEIAIVDNIVQTDQFTDPTRLFFIPLATQTINRGITIPDR